MDERLDINAKIRPTLIRMEDSIIFDLFERTQFKSNLAIYLPGVIQMPRPDLSFFDFLFYGTERLHAMVGRYNHSQEHSFFKNLPETQIKRVMEDSPIKQVNINVNSRIKEMYLQAIRSICESGDDKHYGSTALCDIKTLQDLSRRIHFGTYVAESKFQQEPEKYTELIKGKDVESILEALTNNGVEESIFERVREKGEKYDVNPEFIVSFYKDKIIPFTKDVEIEYFMKRSG